MPLLTKGLAVLAVSTVGVLGVSTLPPVALDAAEMGAVTIRVELDVPHGTVPSAGPKVQQVTDVSPGSGFELTGADTIANPSGWSGSLAVDIDPEAETVIVTADGYGDFQTATVRISGAEFASFTLVMDGLWEDGPQMSQSIELDDGDVTVGWASPPDTDHATQLSETGAIFGFTSEDSDGDATTTTTTTTTVPDGTIQPPGGDDSSDTADREDTEATSPDDRDDPDAADPRTGKPVYTG